MAIQWHRRKDGDWFALFGGREVAWLMRVNRSPTQWWWSVPQAHESGYVKTLREAKAAAEASIAKYG